MVFRQKKWPVIRKIKYHFRIEANLKELKLHLPFQEHHPRQNAVAVAAMIPFIEKNRNTGIITPKIPIMLNLLNIARTIAANIAIPVEKRSSLSNENRYTSLRLKSSMSLYQQC